MNPAVFQMNNITTPQRREKKYYLKCQLNSWTYTLGLQKKGHCKLISNTFYRFVFHEDIGAEILKVMYVRCGVEEMMEKVSLMLEVPGYLYRRKLQNGMEEGQGGPCTVGPRLYIPRGVSIHI